MSYFRHGDPLDDFDRHDREQAKEIAKLPICEICGEAIQDEHLYLINDEFICPACLERDFRKRTEDYTDN